MKITRRIVGISAAVLAATMLPIQVASAASLISHDLVVKNVGSRKLKVCKDWTSSMRTQAGPCSGGTCYLTRNQNSKDKCGWADTDGVRVDHGYSLKESVIGPDPTVWGCREHTFWVKVQPSLFDHHRKFYLKKCEAFA